MPVRRFAFMCGLLFMVARPLAAHEGRQHLIGNVQDVHDDKLVVRTTAGDVVTVHADARTRYFKIDSPGHRADLKVGARVVVDADPVAGRLVAREVRIGVMEPAGSARAEGRRGGDPGHAGHARPAPGAKTDRGASHAGHDAPTTAAGTGAHAGHQPSTPPAEAPASDADHAGMRHAQAAATPQPAHAMPSPRNLFQSDMSIMAGMRPEDPMAGTALPDWQWMTMGTTRVVYNRQGGPSGESAVESTNWTMLMAQHDLGRGRLTLMMMNSGEPATLEDAGSPQLFQTGETFQGRPLVDRQHPHDLFMNLSATYRAGWGSNGAWWAQAALRGEPALGPTTFMHRASAGENPAPILGHHYQDSTHISDVVFTAGLGWRRAALEMSALRGREPDEGRWDLDTAAPDSVSARVKVWPADGWSGQVSYGFLKRPEALEEGDIRRMTASVHYGEMGDRPLALSFVWGRNREEHGTFDSFVAEGAWQVTARDHFFARGEVVDRDTHLLETKRLQALQAAGEETVVDILSIYAATLGYVRDLKLFGDRGIFKDLRLGLGGDLTVYGFPDRLEPVYGDFPVSVHAFARARWGRPHGGHHGMRH